MRAEAPLTTGSGRIFALRFPANRFTIRLMTFQEHNKFLAILFFVYGTLNTLSVIAVCLFLFIFSSSIPQIIPQVSDPQMRIEPEFFARFFALIIAFVFIFQLIFTAPAFVAGYALLKRKRWARTAGIIGAVLAAMSFPIGTAICVYALWFLLGDGGKALYLGSDAAGANQVPPRDWRVNAPPSLWDDPTARTTGASQVPPEPTDWRR